MRHKWKKHLDNVARVFIQKRTCEICGGEQYRKVSMVLGVIRKEPWYPKGVRCKRG